MVYDRQAKERHRCSARFGACRSPAAGPKARLRVGAQHKREYHVIGRRFGLAGCGIQAHDCRIRSVGEDPSLSAADTPAHLEHGAQ